MISLPRGPLEPLLSLPGDVVASLRVLPDMAGVAETTSTLGPMDARMAHIEEAMPVLVEVQRHLARVPEALEELEARIEGLSSLLDRFIGSVDRLSESVDQMEAAVGPLSRIASRLPGQGKA